MIVVSCNKYVHCQERRDFYRQITRVKRFCAGVSRGEAKFDMETVTVGCDSLKHFIALLASLLTIPVQIAFGTRISVICRSRTWVFDFLRLCLRVVKRGVTVTFDGRGQDL